MLKRVLKAVPSRPERGLYLVVIGVLTVGLLVTMNTVRVQQSELNALIVDHAQERAHWQSDAAHAKRLADEAKEQAIEAEKRAMDALRLAQIQRQVAAEQAKRAAGRETEEAQ